MSEALRPLPFHEALASALERLEPGLWRWFSSDSYGQKYADNVRLELLRSTYRLPRESHAKLYQIADEVARAFELDLPLTLYQASGDDGLNASLVFVPSEAHLVLRGSVEQLLDEGELKALFGHELAHHKFWTAEAGRFRVADEVIEYAARHRDRAPSHVQSALRSRRWTEIYADRGALLACGDLHTAVALLVKVATGLAQVDAAAYIAQAREAMAGKSDGGGSSTHPEVFVRVSALRAWHSGEGDAKVGEFVAGKLELEALDLVQQTELTELTQRFLERVLAPEWMRTEATLAHAHRFFPDQPFSGAAHGAFELPEGGDSTREYFAYLLLDFALTDPEIEELALAHAVHVARELGVHAALAKIARKELRMSAASWAEVEQRGRELSKRGPSEPASEVSP